MASSLYDISVASYLQVLDGFVSTLDKGSAHCAENNIDPDTLLGHKLADDMLPLNFQLHMVSVHSLGSVEAVRAGAFQPGRSVPELSYQGFRDKIAADAETLRAMQADEVDALAGKAVTFTIGEMKMPFTAEGFVLSFSLPNLYFHITAAYAILRAAGAPIGKRDFLGKMRMAS